MFGGMRINQSGTNRRELWLLEEELGENQAKLNGCLLVLPCRLLFNDNVVFYFCVCYLILHLVPCLTLTSTLRFRAAGFLLQGRSLIFNLAPLKAALRVSAGTCTRNAHTMPSVPIFDLGVCMLTPSDGAPSYHRALPLCLRPSSLRADLGFSCSTSRD